jgi:hypothetical protein
MDIVNAWNYMLFGGPAEWCIWAAEDGDRLAEWITAQKHAEWFRNRQLGPQPGSRKLF